VNQIVQMIAFISLSSLAYAAEKYPCGEKTKLIRPYGRVELRVDCKLIKGQKWIAEFQGENLHGTSMGFDSASGRKLDSCFYINGEKDGSSLMWDSLGNIVNRSTYRNGRYIGKREVYFKPAHPSLIKSYNAKGQEDGLWEEWWKNGNKKAVFLAKNGEIISGTEYYQDGQLRVRYRTKYEPKTRNVFKIKRIDAEAWTPNGKSTGKISNGNGEWVVFPDSKESADNVVFREVYKDSLMIKGEKLDSAATAQWLMP
jgi:antitoxin component YwqK of YwqJK toxin-antitoxin module